MSAGWASIFIMVASCWLVGRLYLDWFFLTRPRKHALGTVAKHDRISGEGGDTPLLVIRFETDDSRVVDVRGSLGRWSHQFDVGSIIGVEYPVGHPNKARLLQSRPVAIDYVVCLVILTIGIASLINPRWMDLIW
jgi:hypothetical protein